MGSKYIISGKNFVTETTSSSYIDLPSTNHSLELDKKQDNAIEEYIGEIEHSDPQIDDVYKLLEDFIVRNIFGKSNLKILDVGCGIDPNYPKYVATFEKNMDETNNLYVGLDPIAYQNEKRKYPFICGRIEDVPQFLDTKFDVFIFSTCLDHFENLENVAGSVRKIASPNAQCIVWIGLHDTSIVAEQGGAQLFPLLYSNLNLIKFIPRFITTCVKLLANFFYYQKRERKLKNKQPLDNLHFHYFTSDSIKQSLAFFGQVTDERKIPGTNGMFYSIRMK